MRTGVPVFMRAAVMPWRVMLSVSRSTAGSAMRPPGSCLRPMCSRPLRKVPAVSTTLFARSSTPHTVLTPTARPCSTMSSSAWSCQMSRRSVRSSTERHCQMNLPRSHWARGLHTAGPFERLSMRNCMAVASVTRPICPPSASISLTICPFAMPPTAGLQLIWAILFMSIVTRHVLAPMPAEAAAASQPACPPPITITSYFKIMFILFFRHVGTASAVLFPQLCRRPRGGVPCRPQAACTLRYICRRQPGFAASRYSAGLAACQLVCSRRVRRQRKSKN